MNPNLDVLNFPATAKTLSQKIAYLKNIGWSFFSVATSLGITSAEAKEMYAEITGLRNVE